MDARWTVEQVLALSPDTPSRKAAAKLARPAPWSEAGTARTDAGVLVWGLCAGSGSTPYRAAVLPDAPAYSCSCPSRKFPCKHVLALLLLWSENPAAVPDTADAESGRPEWVASWLSARQTRQAQAETRRANTAAGTGGDPEAARRRAARRAARIAAGVEELDRRLEDRLRTGLAGEDAPASAAAWDDVARRMIDAQAPGLASRAKELAVLPASGEGWPARMLEEYGLLHLLGTGFSRIDTLPDPLAATVRTRIGYTLTRDEVLRGTAVRDDWLVLGRQDTTGEAEVTTRSVWLQGRSTGMLAHLLAHAPRGSAPALSLSPGTAFPGDLVHYPGARPLRAELADRTGDTRAAPVPAPTGTGSISDGLDAYTSALRDDPWLEQWPAVLDGVLPQPCPSGAGWLLTDTAADGHALPLTRGFAASPALWRLAALSAGHPVTVFGLVGPHGIEPITAWQRTGHPEHPAPAADLTTP